MSGIGWVDFSAGDRHKVLGIMEWLKDPGVVDELGIGAIRDAISETLFPGITTIQTRAKYFLFVPWLMRQHELTPRAKRSRQPLGDYLEREERAFRVRLVKRYASEREADSTGVIGATFGDDVEHGVVRRPSSIYWHGIRTYKLVDTSLSLAEYTRRYDLKAPEQKQILASDDQQSGDDPDVDETWHSRIRIPPLPRDTYFGTPSIELTPEEATFLRHKIVASVPESLLGQVLVRDRDIRAFLKLLQADRAEQFSVLSQSRLLGTLRERSAASIVRLGEDFWTLLRGAHIRYNVLVQRKRGTTTKASEFTEEWETWRRELARFPRKRWKTANLFELTSQRRVRLKPYTRLFLDGWIEEALAGAKNAERCDQLVADQEWNNKRRRARLRGGNDDRVKNWIGLGHIEYRLSAALRIVGDIHRAANGTRN
jgi:hypothetical protein